MNRHLRYKDTLVSYQDAAQVFCLFGAFSYLVMNPFAYSLYIAPKGY